MKTMSMTGTNPSREGSRAPTHLAPPQPSSFDSEPSTQLQMTAVDCGNLAPLHPIFRTKLHQTAANCSKLQMKAQLQTPARRGPVKQRLVNPKSQIVNTRKS
jgi:hypothetical protein